MRTYFSARVSAETLQCLRLEAGRQHRSLANYAGRILAEYVEALQAAPGQCLDERETSQ